MTTPSCRSVTTGDARRGDGVGVTGARRAPYGRRGASVARAVLDLYADAPPAVRAHVRVRWFTCPLPAVEAQLPAGGRVLEVGCGHGLLSLLAAVSDPERSVVGVDVDERKIPHARAAAARARERGATVDIRVAPPGKLPDGPWDAVVVVDVLYLLHRDVSRRLLAEGAARLVPGGVLAVKEMALAPRWKFRWNQVQELLAVKALGITVGGQTTYVDPREMGDWMAAEGLDVRHLPLSKGYPHPHHLVVGRAGTGP
ncbi:MAG: methyltransferase domain-containing protein [Acidimicrobiales bacterium]